MWIAVTAVLSTALAWLAALSLALAVNAYAGHVPELTVVLRALARVTLHLGQIGAPVALGALGAAALTLGVALRQEARTARSVRHG